MKPLLSMVMVLCAASLGATVYFDLDDSFIVDGNWNAVGPWTEGFQVENAIDGSGNITGVSFSCTDAFAGANSGGDAGVTAYPPNAGKDSFYLSTANNYARVVIGGLIAGQSYDMSFFGSRASSGPRALDISSGGQSVYLDAAYNKSNVVSINGVVADSGGSVAVAVRLASGSSYGYLGVIEITGEFSEPLIDDDSAIYVSPAGSDSNPGTLLHPVATFQAAVGRARDYKQTKGIPEGGLNVYFREGKYFINSMLTLTAADSGQNGKPIIYGSYPGERARFIGGVELNDQNFAAVTSLDAVWSRLDEAAKGNLLKMDISSLGISDYGTPNNSPSELSFNGRIMQMGRWPNGTYVTSVSPVTDTSFTYTDTRPERWVNAEEPYLFGQLNNGYFSSVIAVTNINTSQKTITLAESPLGRGCYPKKAWSVVNVLEEIDEAGEYFIDKNNDILYFWPPSDIAGSELLLSTYGSSSERFFDINGLSNVMFRDITFEMFRNRITKVWSANSITYDGCVFRNGGSSAVTFTQTTNLTVKNCELYDMGSTGMSFDQCGDRYSLTSSNNLLTNNYFRGTGRWKNGLGYAPPVWLYSTNCGFTISHNRFEDTRHAGLVVFGGILATVEYNRFHNCCYEVDDLAPIYTAGGWIGQQGAVYRYNEFYDIRNKNLPGDYGSHGVHAIYYDGPSGASAIGNIGHTLEDRIWFNNNGRDVFYKDNITVNAGRVYYANDESASRGCDLLASILEYDYNVPGSAWYETFEHLRQIPADCAAPEFLSNVHSFGLIESGLNWQCGDLTYGTGIPYYQINYDNIINADPQFLDEQNLVFALADDSPAYSIPGFNRIPWEQIGILDTAKAIRGIPLDESVEQNTQLNLYWAPALDAVSHKLYLSDNMQLVALRDSQAYLGQSNLPEIKDLTLAKSKIYYWAVDEYDTGGNLMGSGDVWSFSTIAIDGDMNFDGQVDIIDFSELGSCWLSSTSLESPGQYPYKPYCEYADIDKNNTVELADLKLLVNNWLSN